MVLQVAIESMKYRKNIVDIDATIICEKDSHKGIIIGKGGQMLKTIGSKARPEIEDMLQCKVNLQLWVKVKRTGATVISSLKILATNSKDAE